ncbi:MAG: hypothetical protein K6T17_04895 [Fimbriimonadales bacterium]|nr:hypothetical protein [Fimbriimonadales bacterium]
MRRSIVVGFVLVFALSVALAQVGGGGRGGGRAGGFQGGMGMMGVGPFAGISLLLRPDVQQELQITEQQRQQIQEAMQALRPAGGPGGGPGGRGGAGGGLDPQQRDQQTAEVEKTIKGILNESQYARYRELLAQWLGAEALARKDYADEVGLTSDQRLKIQEIQRQAQQRLREELQAAREAGGDFQAIRQKLEQIRVETRQQILNLLTPEQKTKWQQIQGKPFRFQEIRSPF